MASYRKKIGAVKGLLSEWYGEERGGRELVSYQRKPAPLADVVGKVLKNLVSEEDLVMMKIKSAWPEIAGAQIAGIATPLCVRAGAVYVEVTHPLWLRELQAGAGAIIREKINRHAGSGFCKNLKFVPAGGQPPSADGKTWRKD